jgi:hypothetical protein
MPKTHRRSPHEIPYASRPIRESSFQARVIVAARMNGWRIDFGDTQEIHEGTSIYRWLAFFFRGKTEKVQKYLLGKRQDLFTLAYHTHDSRYSQPGFPDLVLVHPRKKRIIFAELKRDDEYPTTEQRLWAAALSCVEEEAPDYISYRLWKPRCWRDIIEDLGGIDPQLFL